MSFYSDIDWNLERETTNDIKVVEDATSINQSIKNILLTNRGEVFFDPLFGSGIRQLLFEKMDIVTEYLLEQEINYAIENYEPRIKINNIDIESNYDTLVYSVSIEYIIIKLDTIGTANVSLNVQGI